MKYSAVKITECKENFINGNLSDFRKGLKKLNKMEIFFLSECFRSLNFNAEQIFLNYL